VSFALDITEAGRADLRQLDTWLQEEILDELERLVVKPPTRRIAGGDLVHDFTRTREGRTFYVFLRLKLVYTAELLRLKSIGVFVGTR